MDIHNWSGTEYFIAQSLLNQGQNLEYIAGLTDEINMWVRFKSKVLSSNKKYLIRRSPEAERGYARQIISRLSPKTDIVFSPSTEPIAYLDVNKPKVFYADATMASIVGYYSWYSNLSRITLKESFLSEKRALETSALALYSSDWAAQSAINDYNINPEKVKVIPFGANIENTLPLCDIKRLIGKRGDKVCKLLFLAVDWERKGGPIVLDTVKYLNETMKLPTTLDIVGIEHVPSDNLPDYVRVHGRISKAHLVEGITKIEQFIAESHFLFVPSRAEAYGLVFCEAMAFGVPCISTRTGGIPTIVKNGENGYLLDLNAGHEEYANLIYKAFSDKETYYTMALDAFNHYEARLNWDVAGKTIIKYLKDL
jgi:glycosyltransferase involved in cell wall biosynthesis